MEAETAPFIEVPQFLTKNRIQDPASWPKNAPERFNTFAPACFKVVSGV
jgi:hypothetical protein